MENCIKPVPGLLTIATTSPKMWYFFRISFCFLDILEFSKNKVDMKNKYLDIQLWDSRILQYSHIPANCNIWIFSFDK